MLSNAFVGQFSSLALICFKFMQVWRV